MPVRAGHQRHQFRGTAGESVQAEQVETFRQPRVSAKDLEFNPADRPRAIDFPLRERRLHREVVPVGDAAFEIVLRRVGLRVGDELRHAQLPV